MKKANQTFREILLPFAALHGTITVFAALVYVVGLDKVMFALKLLYPTFRGAMPF